MTNTENLFELVYILMDRKQMTASQLADYFCVSMDFLRGKYYSISEYPMDSNNMDYWIELIDLIKLNRVEEKRVFEYLRLKINNFK